MLHIYDMDESIINAYKRLKNVDTFLQNSYNKKDIIHYLLISQYIDHRLNHGNLLGIESFCTDDIIFF